MIGIVRGWLGHIKTAAERRMAIDELSQMSDAQLRDIGVERGSIAEVFDGVVVRGATERPGQGKAVSGSRAFA